MKITIPLAVHLKNKRISLSLNTIKALHHIQYNNVKRLVTDMVHQQLDSQDVEELKAPVCLSVTMFVTDGQRKDLCNFCGVAEKFVSDAVVSYGILRDDDVRYIKRVEYVFGGKDGGEARTELEYREMK